MKNETMRWLKSQFKGKISITKGLMIAFAITGILSYAEGETSSTPTTIVDITINNVHEDKGIELGDNSRARGEGSIATGRNSIAIGKNAVATGNNETKETIENKLRENRQKLDEIADKEKEVVRLSKELEDIKIRHRETIEAGIRVEQIRKSKENAKKEWDRLKQEYETSVNNSAAFFKENQAKIDDLNSRLAGLSQIQGVDISSEEGLNHAAGELKRIAENGTNLNLTLDFYKDYINSYYRALGDLREKYSVSSKFNESHFSENYGTTINNSSLVNGYQYIDFVSNLQGGIRNGESYMLFDSGSNTNLSYHGNNLYKNIFKNTSNPPTKDIVAINHNADIVTKNQYDEVISLAPKYKESFRDYFNKNNDMFLTPEIKEKMYEVFDLKIDYKTKQYEIAYYQGEYEKTRNNTWLDKKKVALEELKNIEKEFKLKPNIKDLKINVYNKWKKENIDNVIEKNKLTINTLTSELETALGINKNAILEKQKEFNAMKAKSDQAETNYNSINPSEKDLILAREYEALSREIAEKGQNLKTASERLKYLRDNLTLNDLTNKGSDSIAFGTNTIASGNSSIAFGKGNISTKENAVAIGNTNLVDGTNSVAIGTGNNVLKDNSYVLGSQNTLNKSNVYIIGSNVDATDIENAVVLGNESKAVSNAVSIGKENGLRKLVYLEDGEISENSKEAINGSQLHKIKEGNADSINKAGWQATLGDGKNEANNTGLINGSTLNKSLEGYIKKDGSNIDQTSKEAIISKLSEGADVSNPTGSVITDNKLKEVLEEKNYVTNSDIENKANKDGSNIEIDKYIAKLNVGANIETPTDKLVKDSDVKKYLDSNYTKSSDLEDKFNTKANKSDLDNKLNVDVSNLSDKGKENLIKKIGNGNLDKPIGELVTDTIIKEKLDIKLNKDFSNLSYSDKESIRNNLDVYSKSETDNRILESEKKMAAGMANSIAHANVPQVSENYLFALGAGTGYYNGESAVALGISGQTKNKRVVYKLNVGIDTKTKVSVGAGINVNLGIIEEPKQEIKEVPLAPIIYNNKEVKDLERKNKELEERLNELSKLLKDFTSKKEVKTEKILLSNFDFDKYELKESHKNQLDSILEKEFSIIIITGYTDEKGTVEYNQVLSEKRAKAVYDYLKEKGINRDIYYLGKGETSLLSSIDDSLNRRVEISIR